MVVSLDTKYPADSRRPCHRTVARVIRLLRGGYLSTHDLWARRPPEGIYGKRGVIRYIFYEFPGRVLYPGGRVRIWPQRGPSVAGRGAPPYRRLLTPRRRLTADGGAPGAPFGTGGRTRSQGGKGRVPPLGPFCPTLGPFGLLTQMPSPPSGGASGGGGRRNA